MTMRLDFERIAAGIASGASVLDLGCGGGDMLDYLQRERGVRGVGADIDRHNLIQCIEKGVQAVHCDISGGLAMFDDDSFDVVVLSDTLQSVQSPPQELLSDMLRIGRLAIVSFPNFGYWRLRLQLLGGRMPSGRQLPHAWHNTPNVRYCTIRDFEEMCRTESFYVHQSIFLQGGAEINTAANWRTEMAIYHLTRVPVHSGG